MQQQSLSVCLVNKMDTVKSTEVYKEAASIFSVLKTLGEETGGGGGGGDVAKVHVILEQSCTKSWMMQLTKTLLPHFKL